MFFWTRILAARRRAAACGALLLGLVTLTSCEDAVTNPSDLGGQWRLETLSAPGGPPTAPPATGRFTLELASDGQAFVRADCNGCGGRYVLGSDAVVFSQFACTLILCPSAPFDARYLSMLDGRSSLAVEGGALILTSARGTLRFVR
jgi:heat shock protein HslJ